MRTFEITAKTGGFETVLSINEADFLEILDKLMDGFLDIVAIRTAATYLTRQQAQSG